jgi:hypothetical protein
MNDLNIKASPTKEFFIFMLTRDVTISRAIIDLVDNSVDGARRASPNRDFSGLKIEIFINRESFKVSDNCGGIPVDIARNYAFRFGRPNDAPKTQKSVGQFGVGMKRTFFKLGRKIIVKSATSRSRFRIDLDVDEWIKREEGPDGWHFEFSELEEGIIVSPEGIGTSIEVTKLLPESSQSFETPQFQRELEQSLARDHTLVLAQGLQITLNGKAIEPTDLELLKSDKLAPAATTKVYYQGEAHPVTVRILAGVSRREKEDGGWYVFCNERMILKADQSAITGWGDGDGKRFPKYHPDFAFFRGYVFFECEDAAKLPWTTTKTGVDADSWLFRAVREEMIELAKPVLGFLRDMARERSEVSQGDRPTSDLEASVIDAQAAPLTAVAPESMFKSPPSRQPEPGPRMQKIQYFKPLEEVNELKAHLKVKTFTDVGLKTFDYYREYEMGITE